MNNEKITACFILIELLLQYYTEVVHFLKSIQRAKYETRFISQIKEQNATGDKMNLFLFYPSGRFTTFVQDYVYSLEAFVADVGGYLGLCLGMSILTFYDAAVWFFDKTLVPMCGFDSGPQKRK